MPLKHRTIHHSAQGEGLFKIAFDATTEWVASRSGVVNAGNIGLQGKLEPIGGGHYAQHVKVETPDYKAFLLQHSITNDGGTYEADVISVEQDGKAWVQIDVASPHEHASFKVPALVGNLLDKSLESNVQLFDGNVGNNFTQAPRRINEDQVGDLLDYVLEFKDRQALVFVAGSDSSGSLNNWNSQLEKYFRDSRGVATLWLLDPQATELFNREMVEKGYQIYPWSIRSFQPGLDVNDEQDSIRHRYIPTREIFNSTLGYSRNRLYHMARATALRQPVPEILLEAKTRLQKEITRLRVHKDTNVPNLRQRLEAEQTSLFDLTVKLPFEGERKDEQTVVPPVTKPDVDKEKITSTQITPPEEGEGTGASILSPQSVPSFPEKPVVDPKPKTQRPSAPRATATQRVEGSEEVTAPDEVLTWISTLGEMTGITQGAEQSLQDYLVDLFDLAGQSQESDKKDGRYDEIIEDLNKKNEDLQELNSESELRLEEVSEELSDLEIELSKERKYSQKLAVQLSKLRAPVEAYQQPEDDAPESIEEVLERLKKVPNVEFTGKNKAATVLDSRQNRGILARLCWDFIQTLDNYCKQKNNPDGHSSVHLYLQNERTSSIINRHAPSETKRVQNEEKFSSVRLLEVPEHISPNRRHYMWAHYKLAHDGGKAPRLHYLDADDGKIYIGYIGEHLVSPMTT